MGIRFRKSFPLGSLLRLNVSKSGLSLGMGIKGLNINIGPGGIRRTVGLPGTGLSFQDRQGWSSITEVATAKTPGEGQGAFWIKGIAVVLAIVFAMQLISGRSDAPSTRPTNDVNPAAITPPQPSTDRPLTSPEIRELQTLMKTAGFNTGPIDGIMGPATKQAVKAYLARYGITGSGDPTLITLEKIRAKHSKT